MKKYTFDVKLFATVYVVADSEDQARDRISRDFAGFDELGRINPFIEVGTAVMDGEPDLVEAEEVKE